MATAAPAKPWERARGGSAHSALGGGATRTLAPVAPLSAAAAPPVPPRSNDQNTSSAQGTGVAAGTATTLHSSMLGSSNSLFGNSGLCPVFSRPHSLMKMNKMMILELHEQDLEEDTGVTAGTDPQEGCLGAATAAAWGRTAGALGPGRRRTLGAQGSLAQRAVWAQQREQAGSRTRRACCRAASASCTRSRRSLGG